MEGLYMEGFSVEHINPVLEVVLVWRLVRFLQYLHLVGAGFSIYSLSNPSKCVRRYPLQQFFTI